MRAIFRSSFRRSLSEPNYAIRSIAGLVSFGIVAVAISAAAVWPLSSDSPRVALFSLPVGALLIWALWLLMARPAVYYDDSRLIVVNIARVWVLPWFQVSGVEQRINLVVYLKDGTRIQAVGAPNAKRVYPNKAPWDATSMPILSRNLGPVKRLSNTGLGRNEAEALTGFAEAATDTGAPIERRVLTGSLLTGAVLALVAALGVLLDTLLV